MSIHTLRPSRTDNIEVTALSPTEWSVRDARLARDDARSLLGLVLKSDDRFEVMEFGERVTIRCFATVEAALAHFGCRGGLTAA